MKRGKKGLKKNKEQGLVSDAFIIGIVILLIISIATVALSSSRPAVKNEYYDLPGQLSIFRSNFVQDLSTYDEKISADEIASLLSLDRLLEAEKHTYVAASEVQPITGIIIQNLSFQNVLIGKFWSELYFPENPISKRGIVIALHGHDADSSQMRDVAVELAQTGYIVAVPTFRSMNIDNRDINDDIKVSEFLESNGLSLLGLHVFETRLLMDYLKERFKPQVASDISFICHSGGCLIAFIYMGQYDDSRKVVYDHISGFEELDAGGQMKTHCESYPGLAAHNGTIYNFSRYDALRQDYGKIKLHDVLDFLEG